MEANAGMSLESNSSDLMDLTYTNFFLPLSKIAFGSAIMKRPRTTVMREELRPLITIERPMKKQGIAAILATVFEIFFKNAPIFLMSQIVSSAKKKRRVAMPMKRQIL